MAAVPTFATSPGFLGISRQDRGAAVCVVGVPLDIGTTNRAGARDGPPAIRRASRMLVDGIHPQHWVDPRDLDIADLGEFEIALGDLPASLALIERQAAPCAHLVALGGEHGITLPLLRALARRLGGPVGMLQMDAHLDTWETNFGQAFAHGSVFFHAIQEGLVDPRRMIQVGIRSPVDRETWDWTLAQGVTIVTAQEVHETTPAALADRVRAVLGDGPSYLSFDIDALDPAFAPGTGTPETGGLATWQAQGLLRRLGGLAWAGMDIVEVAPAYDHAEITALAGATMAWEYLALLAKG
jgi:agmatinase